jgi:hypothetical protein
LQHVHVLELEGDDQAGRYAGGSAV